MTSSEKKIWNVAVKKYGDHKKITGAILEGIIKSRSLAANDKDEKSETKPKTSITANDLKDAIDSKIILKAGLQKEIHLVVLELLKQDHLHDKHQPTSKKVLKRL